MTLELFLLKLVWGTKIRIYLGEFLSIVKPLWVADYLYIEHNTIDKALFSYNVIKYYVQDDFLCIVLECKRGVEDEEIFSR